MDRNIRIRGIQPDRPPNAPRFVCKSCGKEYLTFAAVKRANRDGCSHCGSQRIEEVDK